MGDVTPDELDGADTAGQRQGEGEGAKSQFTALKKAITEHAETEEADEFPNVEKARSEAQPIELGEQFLKVDV